MRHFTYRPADRRRLPEARSEERDSCAHLHTREAGEGPATIARWGWVVLLRVFAGLAASHFFGSRKAWDPRPTRNLPAGRSVVSLGEVA